MLLAVGGVLWLGVGGVLLLALIPLLTDINPLVTGSTNDPVGTVTSSIQAHLGLFEPASLLVALAAGLLGVGVIALATGLPRRIPVTGLPPAAGGADVPAWGVVSAGFLFAVCGLSVATTLILAFHLSVFGGVVQGPVALWILQSGLLVVASVTFAEFADRVGASTGNWINLRPAIFYDYAILSVVGLGIAPVASGIEPSSTVLAADLLLACLMTQLFVLPITGFVVWGRFVVYSLFIAPPPQPSEATPSPGASGGKGSHADHPPAHAGTGGSTPSPVPALLAAAPSTMVTGGALPEGWTSRDLVLRLQYLQSSIDQQAQEIVKLRLRLDGVGPPALVTDQRGETGWEATPDPGPRRLTPDRSPARSAARSTDEERNPTTGSS